MPLIPNLRGIDLNLLVILEALIDEVHVSRAASRVGLSQPAASAALDRCRALFGDPLLERSGGGMRLTAKAEALRAPLREALAGVGGVFGHAQLDVGHVHRTVRILMADVLAALCIPALCDKASASAPGIDLVFHPWGGGAAGLDLAEKGMIDVVLSGLYGATDVGRFHIEDVIHQDYVVAMRRGHPAAETFDLDRWLNWPHAIVSASGERHAVLDEVLAGLDRSRRVGVSVPSFLLVPELLRSSDMIAMVPSICLLGEHGRGLVGFAPPVPIPGFTLKLASHRRHEGDVAVRFVCAALTGMLKDLVDHYPRGAALAPAR